MFFKTEIERHCGSERETKWEDSAVMAVGEEQSRGASSWPSRSAAAPCGSTVNVLSAPLNTKWPPGLFSLWSASWFACFLPARILGAGADFHRAARPQLLLWLPNQAAEPLFSAPRIIPHPVASRSAGECPSDTRSQPPPTLYPGLLHRLGAVPVAVSILHPAASHQLDRRSSPEGPTVSALLCASFEAVTRPPPPLKHRCSCFTSLLLFMAGLK